MSESLILYSLDDAINDSKELFLILRIVDQAEPLKKKKNKIKFYGTSKYFAGYTYI
jgi:hypothetical protein